jgi:hypothetical protein
MLDALVIRGLKLGSVTTDVISQITRIPATATHFTALNGAQNVGAHKPFHRASIVELNR